MRKIGQASIVAPEIEQSARGQAITPYYHPLRIKETYWDGSLYGYSVNGTPADCVGALAIFKEKNLPARILLNVNIVPLAEIKGVKITRQGKGALRIPLRNGGTPGETLTTG